MGDCRGKQPQRQQLQMFTGPGGIESGRIDQLALARQAPLQHL
jgi:hypothetical protein